MGKHEDDTRFVDLAHRVRSFGSGLAALPIAAVLYRLHTPHWQWFSLLANSLLWPHVAWLHARGSSKPVWHEKLNQLVDAAMVGAWIAAMRFNLLPSVLLASMMAMDHISAGGWRGIARSLPLLIATSALTAWSANLAWQPDSDMLVVVASLPMMAIYPSWLSLMTFRLGHRIRRQNRQLEEFSRTDALTSLANRNHWLDAVQRELDRYWRNRKPASLLLLDIDHFKQINDHHGHTAGDAVLRALAGVLRDNLRSIDTASRFGGDEFGIVLPETGIGQAHEVAERIRQRIAAMGVDEGSPDPACSVSLGVAEVGPQHADAQAWIKQADVALYLAKAQGRNRVCTSASSESTH